MIEMIKLARDLLISLAMGAIICGYYLMRQPEFVGEWKANVDITYDSIMTEYYADVDCDCGVKQ